MKVPKFLAVGLIAAGLVIGGSSVAHATTESPYVTVAWSYAAHPDLTAPQPFIASTPGANLHAFDALAASPEWCGQPIQIDVYQRSDAHGVSWETLKSAEGLLYGTDGGYLAYNAGVGTPYRVIYPEEIPCVTPNPTPTSSPSGPPESSTPTPTPSESSSPEPTPTSSPTPSASATPTPTPSASSEPTPPSSSPTSSPTTNPSTNPSPSSTPGPSSAPVAAGSSPTTPTAQSAGSPAPADELAFTGSDPLPGILFASVLVAAGIALMIIRRVRRA